MPRFPLEREDGGDLAAYLLDYENGDSSDYPPVSNEKPNDRLSRSGRDLIIEHNCAACHEFPRSERLPRIVKSKAGSDLNISTDHPQYSLSEYQWESIRLFLEDKPSRASATSILETLNCLACHDRNGKGGHTEVNLAFFTGNPDLGDAGKFPRAYGNWIQAAGGLAQGGCPRPPEVRPYLNTRMPHFGKATVP